MSRSHTSLRRAGALAFFALFFALGAAPRERAFAQGEPPSCDDTEVEYLLAATLRLADTPLGKGDGIYTIGPGNVTIRFHSATGRAEMIAYRMTEHFTVQTTALLWKTTVVTDTHTTTTPNGCSTVATGTMSGRTLHWATPLGGYATDGTLTCDGTMCGKFGAPPPGRSELHIPPHPVAFSDFVFAADGKTFSMQSTLVSKTDAPKQTGYLALAGREVRRSCVGAPACR